ncbi:hypothetical protein O0L34_g2479 [Tuta absoluta]|nr:hypothetical protein O0L34_g2479 [Tuta absoluta]
MWPSLVISAVLKDLENNTRFWDTMHEDDLGPLLTTPLYHLITRSIITKYDAMCRLELSGLWKIFGHPIVDSVRSAATWMGKGLLLKQGLAEAADLIANGFKLEFCRQYYKTHGKWPNLDRSSITDPDVMQCYISRTWGETPTRKWTPLMFTGVKFLQTFNFYFQVDAIDVIADKSIIPKSTEWIYEFDRKAHRTDHGYFPSGPPSTTKSVILHYLSQEYVSCEEIIRLIDTGIIPLEWRIMIAVYKEREFKQTDARSYGKLTPEMRLYQVITEKNIAKIIFRYIRHQSMTLSEEELVRTLLRMSSPVEKGDYIFIVLDFSSWCTHFRHESVQKLFSCLDDLFGFKNVYSFTQIFPQISHLIFQDRFKPPRQGANGMPVDGSHSVFGTEAWLEGLRQKGWTLATVVLILIASWNCGTTASLLGQGDNQVILLRLPSAANLLLRNMTVEDYIDHFLEELNRLCDMAGIVIKTQESWFSRRLLEYGRKYYYDGAQVSCSLKKISRVTSEANQTLPTLNTLLSGMFACGASCANEDYSPVPSYVTTILEATVLMYRKYPWMMKRPVEWMTVLWSMSRAVGGYPVSLLPQFMTRAVQDPLSCNLHLLRTLLRSPAHSAHVRALINLTKPAHVDHLSLIKDPPSIPLNIPPQPENMIRNQVKTGLGNIIKNEQVAYLFSRDSSESEETLKQDILAITLHHPKLMNRLWQLSNLGQQEKVLGKFSSSRSIQRAALTSWVNERDLLRNITALEVRQENHLKFSGPRSDAALDALAVNRCVTRFTQGLREMLWDMPLEGITMAPMQELIDVAPWETLSTEDVKSAIYVECHAGDGANMQMTRGPCTPYIGSQTKLRARRSALQVMEVVPSSSPHILSPDSR